jgi:23S rRNA (uracil1939-C5)-methyltransferase
MNESVNLEYQKLKDSLPIKLNGQKPVGHVELYEKDGSVNMSWNKNYAEGGFSQVNSEVNIALQELVSKFVDSKDVVLDLFGGDGNLTHKIECQSKLSIDLYKETPIDSSMFNLNLFEQHALPQFSAENKTDFDTFIVDPPRSGFKLLTEWAAKYRPNKIIYVSCHPATMIRDIRELTKDYEVVHSSLIDLFPSTYHYEAMIVLSKR